MDTTSKGVAAPRADLSTPAVLQNVVVTLNTAFEPLAVSESVLRHTVFVLCVRSPAQTKPSG